MISEKLNKELYLEAERIEEDTEYTAKAQYNNADSWRRRHTWLAVSAAVFAAVAGLTAMNDVAQWKYIIIFLSFFIGNNFCNFSCFEALGKK